MDCSAVARVQEHLPSVQLSQKNYFLSWKRLVGHPLLTTINLGASSSRPKMIQKSFYDFKEDLEFFGRSYSPVDEASGS
jgi:hypothetical protein